MGGADKKALQVARKAALAAQAKREAVATAVENEIQSTLAYARAFGSPKIYQEAAALAAEAKAETVTVAANDRHQHDSAFAPAFGFRKPTPAPENSPATQPKAEQVAAKE